MIDWNDNAKAAVGAFAVHVGYERTAKLWLEGKSKPTQPKTVADAVEWSAKKFNCQGWVYGVYDCITDGSDGLLYADSMKIKPDRKLVCTRAEFEAYVKEQEGEKWTHEYGYVPCRIEIEKPDEHGFIVIYVKGDGYLSCELEDIKPIKTQITAKQAWGKLLADEMTVADILEQYEVIDD